MNKYSWQAHEQNAGLPEYSNTGVAGAENGSGATGDSDATEEQAACSTQFLS